MGTFHTRCRIENPVRRTRGATIHKILVDTGSEYTWVSAKTLERLGVAREKKDVRFVMANGQEITRSVGFAIIRLGQFFTIDEVVFGESGDLPLLGARTLVGLNLTVDSHPSARVYARDRGTVKSLHARGSLEPEPERMRRRERLGVAPRPH